MSLSITLIVFTSILQLTTRIYTNGDYKDLTNGICCQRIKLISSIPGGVCDLVLTGRSSRLLFVSDRIISFTKYCSSDADMRCTFFDGDLKITGHTHGQRVRRHIIKGLPIDVNR